MKNIHVIPTDKPSREVWKDVIGYEGLYQVSNFGNVKSLGNLKSKKEKILKQHSSGKNSNYYTVSLNKNGESKKIKTHQLVAICFLNHKPDGTNKIVVDHINKNTLDNKLENLRLISNRENLSAQGGTSKFVGVYFCKHYKKWISKIQVNGKKVSLGYFNIENDAKEVYQNALISLKNNDTSFIKYNKKSSSYKGVSWDKRRNKWLVQLKKNYKKIFIGRYKTEVEANDAYIKHLEILKNL